MCVYCVWVCVYVSVLSSNLSNLSRRKLDRLEKRGREGGILLVSWYLLHSPRRSCECVDMMIETSLFSTEKVPNLAGGM